MIWLKSIKYSDDVKLEVLPTVLDAVNNQKEPGG